MNFLFLTFTLHFSSREVIVDRNHTVWPNGIALDFESKQLYYVDAYLELLTA